MEVPVTYEQLGPVQVDSDPEAWKTPSAYTSPGPFAVICVSQPSEVAVPRPDGIETSEPGQPESPGRSFIAVQEAHVVQPIRALPLVTSVETVNGCPAGTHVGP
jgi:hypothetical protein